MEQIKTAREAIASMQSQFDKGALVEAVEGTPARVYAIVRPSIDADHLITINIGMMTGPDFILLMDWHARQWKKLMKDKKFRRWARHHPIPEGIPASLEALKGAAPGQVNRN